MTASAGRTGRPRPWRDRPAVIGLAAMALGALHGCSRSQGGSTVRPDATDTTPQAAASAAMPAEVAIDSLPLGDLAGAAHDTRAQVIRNPFEGQPEAIAEGKSLFIRMNCAGCHGYEAKGGMGPNLTDSYWRYGGLPVSVYRSIHDGRPQGMPAWNPALPPADIWKIVAWLQTLGGTYPSGAEQASMQGDRAGDKVAPEAAATLAPGASGVPNGKSTGAVASPGEARPDAGGKP